MAVLRVEFDNVLCFKDFKADFTYPRTLVDSPLENEFLKRFPKIRYRKVNIIIGANASGKTSLGKAIWKTLLFLNNKEVKPVREMISDETKDAFILLDFIFENGLFFRLEIKLLKDGKTLVRYRTIQANEDDSYKDLVGALDDSVEYANYVEALEKAFITGFNFQFPSTEGGFDRIKCDYNSDSEKKMFVEIFEKVLKTFDPSIKEVFISTELEKTFVIKFKNGNTVAVTNGNKLSGLERLSSGTKYAINIAGIIYSIKNHKNGFYYVDEQFSYVNSDIEIACLTTMVDLLEDGEQLFFTTHNQELLSLRFPNHTFNFLRKKEDENGDFYIELDDASKYEKRNNVNIKNLYENDYFNVSPNTDMIFEVVD